MGGGVSFELRLLVLDDTLVYAGDRCGWLAVVQGIMLIRMADIQ